MASPRHLTIVETLEPRFVIRRGSMTPRISPSLTSTRQPAGLGPGGDV